MEKENIFLAEEKKNREGKILEMENVFYGGEEGRRRKGGEYKDKENVSIAGQTNDNKQGKMGLSANGG